jgi:CubicO group peptidase (beta-lactamase class C family)
MRNQYIFIFLVLLIAFACEKKQNMVFPKHEWAISKPEEQGIDSEKLTIALSYLAEHSLYNKNREVLIIRNGYQIFAGPNVDSVHNIWSCSKTFTSAVLGLLCDDRKLTPDIKAWEFEPQLKVLYPDVTFRHFASMTSGYSAKGRSRWNDENADWSYTPYEPDTPFFKPGASFAYWDEAQMMYGRALTQVLQRPMIDYLKERITDPIGMGFWEWHSEGELNGIQINNGCTNVHLCAEQLARWGYLFLNKGNWNGKQLLSREWVKQATSVQVPAMLPTGDTDRKNITGSGCYGFNWWVNGRDKNGKLYWPDVPEGTFYASGLNNNKCIVIPRWSMVIVRMGEDGHPQNEDKVYNTFLGLIGKSLSF